MINNVFSLIWVFLFYSVLGWVMETAYSTIRHKQFSNRGVINGPFCVNYGIGASIITIFGSELTGIWLFVGAGIIATVIEWNAGHLVERWYHQRWWDHKNHKWNLDGYISFKASLIWAALGYISIKWVNRFAFYIYNEMPDVLMMIIIVIIFSVLIIDAAATIIVLHNKSKYIEKWKKTDDWLDSISNRMNRGIANFVQSRVQNAYPRKKNIIYKEKHPEIFAYGCSAFKIFLLFFIASLLGDLIETIYCRIGTGIWMSRSSLVWGRFSIVWGLAIGIVTLLLYKYKDRSDTFLFFMGTFLGGAYEYICSVFTELFFGKIFWDYSEIPFNLGGRINLLYCFFWGFATVIWFKNLYPILSILIEKIPKKIGLILSWSLIIFMSANIFVSSIAMIRYDERENGIKASNGIEEWIDETFPDNRMEKIYPNAISTRT